MDHPRGKAQGGKRSRVPHTLNQSINQLICAVICSPVPTGLSMKSRLASFNQVVFRGCKFTSSGPISAKFPKPVPDAPGPPCREQKDKSNQREGVENSKQINQSINHLTIYLKPQHERCILLFSLIVVQPPECIRIGLKR